MGKAVVVNAGKNEGNLDNVSASKKMMTYMLAAMTDNYLVHLEAFFWAHEMPHMLESWMVQLTVIKLRCSRSLVYISQALLLLKSDNQYNY